VEEDGNLPLRTVRSIFVGARIRFKWRYVRSDFESRPPTLVIVTVTSELSKSHRLNFTVRGHRIYPSGFGRVSVRSRRSHELLLANISSCADSCTMNPRGFVRSPPCNGIERYLFCEYGASDDAVIVSARIINHATETRIYGIYTLTSTDGTRCSKCDFATKSPRRRVFTVEKLTSFFIRRPIGIFTSCKNKPMHLDLR